MVGLKDNNNSDAPSTSMSGVSFEELSATAAKEAMTKRTLADHSWVNMVESSFDLSKITGR